MWHLGSSQLYCHQNSLTPRVSLLMCEIKSRSLQRSCGYLSLAVSTFGEELPGNYISLKIDGSGPDC
jgi:hypothetical protein